MYLLALRKTHGGNAREGTSGMPEFKVEMTVWDVRSAPIPEFGKVLMILKLHIQNWQANGVRKGIR